MTQYQSLVARILLSHIFILAGFNKITGYAGTQGYMEAMGVPGMLLPLVIAIGHNTLWGSSPITAQEFSAFAIDGNLAKQSALAVREGPGKYIPGGALIAFYGILIIMGMISIYMGLRDAYIAIMFGNDMYGTSLPFKTSKVLGHLIFGLGLIFINQTQCLMVMTFGGTQSMCW